MAQASKGRNVIDLFRQHQLDVTLIDLRMPQMDGVKAIALLWQEVHNIVSKLGVDDRTQTTTLTVKHGIVRLQ